MFGEPKNFALGAQSIFFCRSVGDGEKKFNKIGARAATSIETVDRSHPMTSLAKETNVCGELPKTARVLRMVNRSVTMKVNPRLSIKNPFHNFL
jgi:hypothetical protein